MRLYVDAKNRKTISLGVPEIVQIWNSEAQYLGYDAKAGNSLSVIGKHTFCKLDSKST